MCQYPNDMFFIALAYFILKKSQKKSVQLLKDAYLSKINIISSIDILLKPLNKVCHIQLYRALRRDIFQLYSLIHIINLCAKILFF